MHKPSRVLVLASQKALLGHTLLRVVVGGVMAAHGLQKVLDPGQFQHRLETMGFPVPGLFAYLAIAGELLGGLGLVVGLLTPIAAFGVACTMAVAVLGVHVKNGLFAANGGFEYPLTLLCAALWFMASGAGPYSLDALWRAARDRSPGQGVAAQPAAAPVRPGQAPGEHGAITQAGNESYPASDPPAHSRPHH